MLGKVDQGQEDHKKSVKRVVSPEEINQSYNAKKDSCDDADKIHKLILTT